MSAARRKVRSANDLDEANAAWRRGERDAAMEGLRRSAPHHPHDGAIAAALGGMLLASGKTLEAIPWLTRACEFDPNDARTQADRGLALTRLKRHTEALEAYAAALGHERIASTLTNRAASLIELRRFDEAARDLDEALRLAPGLPGALYNIGALLEVRHRYVGAALAFQHAYDSQPDFLDAYLARGRVQLRIGEYEEAVADYDRALERAASTPAQQAVAWSHRAVALLRLGRVDEALPASEKALALGPGDAEAWHQHGVLLRELGRMEEARAALREALRLAPTSGGIHNDLVQSKRCKPDDPQLEEMRRLVADPAVDPGDEMELRFALGKAYDELGEPGSAMEHWLRGNALVRLGDGYDESAALGEFASVRSQFSRCYIAERRTGGLRGARPIFVFGMPRSGTTLIEQILASHPEAFGAGETDDFVRVVWRIALDGVGGFRFPEVASHLFAPHMAAIGGEYMRMATVHDPRGLRPIDKTTNNYLFAGLIALALPDARIVHMRRNPVDCCLSCFSKKFIGDHGYAYDLAELGRYYRAYDELMAHWRDVLPAGLMIDVDYEALVADQEGETRRLLAHCGLPFDPRCLEFYKTERQIQTASATQVREPLYRRAVARWRAYEPYLEPLLRELGPLAESH